jgi:hypothetical protein
LRLARKGLDNINISLALTIENFCRQPSNEWCENQQIRQPINLVSSVIPAKMKYPRFYSDLAGIGGGTRNIGRRILAESIMLVIEFNLLECQFSPRWSFPRTNHKKIKLRVATPPERTAYASGHTPGFPDSEIVDS